MDRVLENIFEMGTDLTFEDGTKMFSTKNSQAFYEISNAISSKIMDEPKVKKYLTAKKYKDEADFVFSCGSTNTEWVMKQIRSSDEGASIKITCHDCGFVEIRG